MDIVIPVRDGDDNEELRYTLRSLENIPHRKVFICGYTPKWVKNVISIDTDQTGDGHFNIWAKNVLAACNDDRLSDDFILWNDDMYLLHPIDKLKTYHRGHIIDFLRSKGRIGQWHSSIYNTLQELSRMGIKNPLNYELHVPMTMNKHKFIEAYESMNSGDKKPQQIRSVYGNIFNIGGERLSDVKVVKPERYWDENQLFISSGDSTFGQLEAFRFVRELFQKPSDYEEAMKPLVYPPISVVMPVWNQEELVKRAIESVPKDWLILACDDGSTDNTYKVLKEYAKTRKIKVYKNRKNMGVGHTLNKLYDKLPKEGYHVILASDDYFYQDILKVATEIDGSDIVYFDMVNNKGKRWTITPETMVKHSQSIKFIKNSFLGDERTDGSNYQEDVYLMKKLVAKEPTVKFTGILAKHYNHPREGSLSWQGRRGLIEKNKPVEV